MKNPSPKVLIIISSIVLLLFACMIAFILFARKASKEKQKELSLIESSEEKMDNYYQHLKKYGSNLGFSDGWHSRGKTYGQNYYYWFINYDEHILLEARIPLHKGKESKANRVLMHRLSEDNTTCIDQTNINYTKRIEIEGDTLTVYYNYYDESINTKREKGYKYKDTKEDIGYKSNGLKLVLEDIENNKAHRVNALETFFANDGVYLPSEEEKSAKAEVNTEKVDEKEFNINLESFTEGFEEAEFDKFNSPAKENGLGNTLVWMRGYFKDYSELDSYSEAGPACSSIIVLEDSNGLWMCVFELDAYDSNYDRIKNLVGDELIVKGVYQGYSDLYKMPAVYIVSFYDVDTGKEYDSIFGSYALEDALGTLYD